MSKICINCGSQIDDDALFCDICGARIDWQSTNQPVYQYNAPKPKKRHMVLIIVLIIISVVTVKKLLPIPQSHGERTDSDTDASVSELSDISENNSRKTESSIPTESSDVIGSQIEETSGEKTAESKPIDSSKEIESSSTVSSDTETDNPIYESPKESSAAVSSQSEEKSSETAAALPYADSLGSISPTDFVWISDAMSGNLTGDFISRDDLVGKWKAEMIFEGIFELVYISIDTNGTVTIEPYQINYGDGWEDESGEEFYSFNGSFDINRVYGLGSYGKIDLYQFLESDNMQYALGEITTTEGNKGKIYMVRP